MPERDYSSVPLASKLGIRAGTRALLRNAPEGFLGRLAPPAGAQVAERAAGEFDVVLGFATNRRELGAHLALAPKLTAAGGLWVAWPKLRTIPTELSFDVVQRAGLETGLVDNKICRVDDVWQAMRFVRRTADRPASRVR